MYEFITYLPEGYEQSEKDYPLLVFLDNPEIEDVNESVIAKALKNSDLRPEMIIVAPFPEAGQTWKAKKVYDLIALLSMNYRIDQSRIYLSGIGYGGYGALKFATVYKDIPAAILTVGAGGNENMAFYLKNIPLWLIHSENDENIPFYKAQALADKLNDAVNFSFTKSKLSHDELSKQIYSNPETYDWFLKFENK